MNIKKKFAQNLSYAFLAQGVSLIMSILISLMVPKLLGVEEFGYWQLFIFYSSYITFFHFGLNDGIYLKYGGISYDDMNKSSLKSQIYIGLYYETIIAIVIVIISICFMGDPNRIFVVVATSIYFLIYSTSNFLGYVFQAANETKIYSISVIISRIFFAVSILCIFISKTKDYKIFIILYIIGFITSAVYCIYKGRDIFKSETLPIMQAIDETMKSVFIGIKLMLANIASMLILGIGRLVIDNIWGITEFGKISLSITLTNFILTFINQVSIVMFPSLRQTNESQQQKIYSSVRNALGLFLPIVFIGYFPVKILLNIWLPEYQESIQYLAILLPLCTFDGKMQMLCNTYLKVLRYEKKLLQINLFTLVISTVLSLIGGYVFKSINFIIISMVLSVAIRSVYAEIVLNRYMKINILKSLFQEIGLTIVFMICVWYLNTTYAFGVVLASYVIYLSVNKKLVMNIMQDIMGVIKRD